MTFEHAVFEQVRLNRLCLSFSVINVNTDATSKVYNQRICDRICDMSQTLAEGLLHGRVYGR